MELKKNPEADVHAKSGLFFSIGLMLTLAIVLFAFEYKTYDDANLVDLGQLDDDLEEILDVPLTEQPPPPPPKIQQPEIIEVDDDEEIEEDIEIEFDIDMDEDMVVEDIPFFDDGEKEVADEIFQVVEQQPEPEGGMQAFYQYVQKNMKYPSQARRMGIEGKVFVQFVVNTDGTIQDVEAIKGIGGGCDEEAIRVLKAAPAWKPGKQRGKAVRVRMVIPITFKLG
ncbi:MAG: energy transducer TonB [Cyclobacteriaceae bacterium]|nr:energy transducer TonB [Cyclobacteriaceae bacterium]MCH8515583.1 energy transducer TonB [Cyclobacteriaceae bacterium]